MGDAALNALHLAAHLVRRFFGALDPRGPAPGDERWALDRLGPGEVALWCSMSGPDRRHALGVARAVVAELGTAALPPVVAAALLHDVGKVESGFGTVARVPVTVLGLLTGRARTERWGARIESYLHHDEVGAELVAAGGGHPLTVAWAREHHLPERSWTVPVPLGRALKAADDD